MSLWLIAIIAVAFGMAILVSLWIVITRVSKQAKREWFAENPAKEILLISDGAHCSAFPGESVPLRGNGLLVLTRDELHFKLWAPRRDLIVPLRRIYKVDIAGSFAGRWGRLPLLHIAFDDEFGRQLETAWAMPGAKRWADEIIEKRKSGNDV
jgi:hypothetical protein